MDNVGSAMKGGLIKNIGSGPSKLVRCTNGSKERLSWQENAYQPCCWRLSLMASIFVLNYN